MKFYSTNVLCRFPYLPFIRKISSVSYKYSEDFKHLYCEESHETIKNVAYYLVHQADLETVDARSCGISQIDLDIYIENELQYFYLHKLHTANFPHNKIESIENYCFFSLQYGLQTLNLSNNIITNIEYKAFHHLAKLEILDLSNNLITYIISSSFQHLYQLKEFYFANNQLQVLQFELFKNSRLLQIMNFSYNKIAQISFFETVWENIKILDLSNNTISQLDPNTTSKYFPNLKSSETSKDIIAKLIEKSECAESFLIAYITIITILILIIIYQLCCGPERVCFARNKSHSQPSTTAVESVNMNPIYENQL
jgi:Leucine-rich repeat (LRR) protein